MGRIISAIGIDQDVGGTVRLLPLGQVDAEERLRQPVARLAVDGVLEAGERRLTGQIGITEETAADQFQQGVGAQGIAVVLILVAAGNLKDALADERLQRVLHRSGSPVGQVCGECVAEPEGGIGLGEPHQAAVAG